MLANFSNLITFSRGSNATVTDASGRLTYAANNLVTNSQDFEAAAWTKANATVTANAVTAPDGTMTADKLVETAASGSHYVLQSLTAAATPYVFSAYIKAAERTFAMIFNAQSNAAQVINLSTGALAGNAGLSAPANASVTAFDNGWYRVSMVFTPPAGSNNFRIYAMSDANTFTYNGDGTSGIFIWGAQLEAVTYQTTPSPYVSTSVANLLGFSEDFTNAAWTKQRASIVPNAAQNPINGLWNAQKLMEDTTASNSHRVSSALITMPSGILSTVSVYMKAAERTWAYITDAGVTNSGAYVNLATGEFGTINGGVTRSSIQSVGNGWYRVSISGYLAGTLSQLLVSVATSNGNFSYTGDGNSGIYIYGAQLSNSGSLDPYVPTPAAAPSSTAYYGPRYDYDPVTLAAKGILIEEARTNLVLTSAFQTLAGSAGSQYPSGSGWSNLFNTGGTRTYVPSSVFSGGQAVDIASVSAARNVIAFSFTPAASTTYTVSFYVESVSGATGVVAYTTGFLGTGGTTNNVSAPTTTGRYTYTFTTGTTPGSVDLRFGIGCATNESGSIRISNVQCEAGAFATSYIPTVASQVTRSADVASITGSLFSQWYNLNEGTLVVQAITQLSNAQNQFLATVTDGTTTNRATIFKATSGFGGFRVTAGGVAANPTAPSAALTGNLSHKAALSISVGNNNVNCAADTLLGTASSTSTMPTGISTLRLGVSETASADWLNGHIQSIQYIPNAVSNTQLQSLTAS